MAGAKARQGRAGRVTIGQLWTRVRFPVPSARRSPDLDGARRRPRAEVAEVPNIPPMSGGAQRAGKLPRPRPVLRMEEADHRCGRRVRHRAGLHPGSEGDSRSGQTARLSLSGHRPAPVVDDDTTFQRRRCGRGRRVAGPPRWGLLGLPGPCASLRVGQGVGAAAWGVRGLGGVRAWTGLLGSGTGRWRRRRHFLQRRRPRRRHRLGQG